MSNDAPETENLLMRIMTHAESSGYRAGYHGSPITRCHYRQDAKRAEWFRGWRMGEADRLRVRTATDAIADRLMAEAGIETKELTDPQRSST